MKPINRSSLGILIISVMLVAGLWIERQNKDLIEIRNSASPETQVETKTRSRSSDSLTHTSRLQMSLNDLEKRDLSTHFTQYLDLCSKALRSEEENRALAKYLSSPDLVGQSFEVLAAKDESVFDLDAQERRLEQVEFLSRALSLRDNPMRGRVLQALPAIIARDIASMDVNPMLKRSLAGDQIELFQILQKSDVAAAEALADRSKGTANEKLIAYAIKNQERI
jgi:hypothetical protein